MKKRVLIIVDNLGLGGAEFIAAQTSKALAEAYEVLLVTYRPRIDYEYGGNYKCLSLYGENIAGKVICAIKRLIAIRNIKKSFDPDFSISLMANANIPNAFIRNHDIVITSVHANPEYNVRKNSLNYFFRKKALSKSDYFVTPSIGIKNEICRFYSLNSTIINVIYNACNISIEEGKSSNFAEKCEYIYTIGRLSQEKGQWHLIKAFSVVHKRHPGIKLKVIGEGTMMDALKQLCCDLEISENVIFTGFINNPTSELEEGNIFVLTSLTESFSNVIVEAMSKGQLCISTDCNYGPREILNNGDDGQVKERFDALYGILIPPFTEKAPNYSTEINDEEKLLADTICDCISNNELRKHYCELGLLRAKDFTYAKYKKQWNDFLEALDKKSIKTK